MEEPKDQDRAKADETNEKVDTTEEDMQRKAEKNANPLAPPINNRGGS